MRPRQLLLQGLAPGLRTAARPDDVCERSTMTDVGGNRHAQDLPADCRGQEKATAIVSKRLAARNGPEAEWVGVAGLVVVGRDPNERVRGTAPDRLHHARILVWVFRKRQTPPFDKVVGIALVSCAILPIVGIAAKVLPSNRRTVEVQDIQVCSGRMPRACIDP